MQIFEFCTTCCAYMYKVSEKRKLLFSGKNNDPSKVKLYLLEEKEKYRFYTKSPRRKTGGEMSSFSISQETKIYNVTTLKLTSKQVQNSENVISRNVELKIS